MHPRRRRTLLGLGLGLIATLAASAAAPRDDDEGFTPLVQGTDPGQFTLVEIGPETISISADGEVALTGKPNGYFATRKSYDDYILRFEWKYDRPEGLKSDADFKGNSGLLLHIEGPHKVWPRCIEFQLQNAEVGKIYPIGGAKLDGEWKADRYKSAIRPVGEWNFEEVRCKDGEMTCILNDVEVTHGTDAEPSRGAIGWQSEGVPIRFRNIRIKPLD